MTSARAATGVTRSDGAHSLKPWHQEWRGKKVGAHDELHLPESELSAKITQGLAQVSKQTKSATILYEEANGLAIAALNEFELLIRKVKYFPDTGRSNVNFAEETAIRDAIKAQKTALQSNSDLLARAFFYHAWFEEKLGGTHTKNALTMYAGLEERFPQFRRAYGYHAKLLLDVGKNDECEALLIKFDPALDEVGHFPKNLKALWEGMRSRQAAAPAPLPSPWEITVPPSSAQAAFFAGTGKDKDRREKAIASTDKQTPATSSIFGFGRGSHLE